MLGTGRVAAAAYVTSDSICGVLRHFPFLDEAQIMQIPPAQLGAISWLWESFAVVASCGGVRHCVSKIYEQRRQLVELRDW